MAEHRWVVDGIEEDVARIEVDGRVERTVPRWLLPRAAREGDVLKVTHERADERSTLTIERDAAATADALARSRETVRAMRRTPGDPGGDVQL